MPRPSDEGDAMGRLFSGLREAFEANAAARKQFKEAVRERRRNDPLWQARRSKAAKKGWETRRVAAEAKQRAADEEAAIDADRYSPTGPTCGEMNHDGRGREIFCNLPPEHDEDECDDLNGNTWQY